MKRILFLIVWFMIGNMVLSAQTQHNYSSVEIYKKIEKLNFLGTVLYVAAHPDDENTAMISYLSNKTNARVAYLSLNRGDGGQNLIGTEIRELLGVIRTEELMSAREIDGGEQFFTRSNDFGYSKNPTETFKFWNKEEVLSDVVRVFRKFKPDVVVNRFNHRTEGDTHGHHTASALLSVEAFNLSGDAKAFPELAEEFGVWQPRRAYFNDSWFFYGSKEKYQAADHTGFLTMELGEYLPLLGKSNSEIAIESRSQHRSQGFGGMGERGSDRTYIEPILGDKEGAEKDIFAGVNTTWSRVKGGEAIGKILSRVQKDFDFENPAQSISDLIEAHRLIQKLDDPYWKNLKTKEIEEILLATTGLYLEAFTNQEQGTLGEKIQVFWEATNRSDIKMKLNNIGFKNLNNNAIEINKTLEDNKRLLEGSEFTIPKDISYSSPYWLREPHTIGMYRVSNPDLIGLPQTPPQLVAVFDIDLQGLNLKVERELIYKTASQVLGEIKEPFAVVPKASLKMKDKVLVFPDNQSRKVEVEVRSYSDDLSGVLQLNTPKNWKVSPSQISLDISKKGSGQSFVFEVTPPKNQEEAVLKPNLEVEGELFDRELYLIDYPHIPTRTVLLPAETKANRISIETKGKNIAYIHGAGDEIPAGLREIGYEVSEISATDLKLEDLKPYDAVILGIRVYNLNEEVIANQEVLFEYVKQGGTLVTQYSQLMGIKIQKIAPYPLEMSAKRVTDEEAAVRFLAPDHPVLNFPNKITAQDFEGWVQERGLYFPSAWSKEFVPIFGMNDSGEEELQGSLLIAPYGKGHYVYTGLSFFRELPAGVPGAYRLFANILAL